MVRFLVVVLCLIGALAHAGPLAAQDQRYSSDGDGTLLTGDRVAHQAIDRVETTLYQNGGIDLRLIQGRDRWIFRGSWYGSPASGSVGFRLDSGFELPADGSGRLYVDGATLTRIDFHGSNRDGAFELTFTTRGRVDGRPNHPAATLDVTREGDGEMARGDDGDRLDRARVRLWDDGRAEVRLWGAMRYTLGGSWSGTVGSGRVRLRLDDWGGDYVDLRGTINTSRRSGWDRLAIEGTARDRAVRMTFAGEGPALDAGDQDEDAPDDPNPLTTLDQTMRGAGTLTLEDGTTVTLRVVRVSLGRHGKAEIALEGSQPGLRLHGKWSQRDNAPRIDLSITKGMARTSMSGAGVLTIPDGAAWERLTLTGRSEQGGWKLAFRGNGPGHLSPDSTMAPVVPPPIRELNATAPGEGTLTWPGVKDPSTVTQVRVTLGKDKKALIEIEGSKPARFTGQWSTTRDPNQLTVAINGGSIKGLAAGGTITLTEQRAVTGVTMDSRVVRQQVHLRFRASAVPVLAPPVH